MSTSSLIPTMSVMIGSTLLSMYPIMIKTIDASMFTHVIIRMLATVIIAYMFITIPVKEVLIDPSYHIISILYLFHIYASYVGFKNLNVGVSLTLFYTYPLINLLIKYFIIDKHYENNKVNIDTDVLKYFIMAIIGVAVISYYSSFDGNQNGTNKDMTISKYAIGLGLLAIFLASISESIMYIFYKVGNHTNPFNMLFTLCFTGSIIMIILAMFNPFKTQLAQTTGPDFIKLVLANIIIGVVGYALRFYSIPLISIEWYSILSFINIIFGYIFGWILLGEKVTKGHIAGTSLIVYAIYQIKKMGY